MLEKMLALFRGESADTGLKAGDRVPLALAVLMLELAHADGSFEAPEQEQMLKLLQRRFDLSPTAGEELLQLASRRRGASVDLYAFTKEINWAFSQEEKEEIAEHLWRLTLVDGVLAAEEHALMRQISHLIGLSHPRMIEAKLRASRAMSA